MNKAILMGRLTRDPEVRYTRSGGAEPPKPPEEGFYPVDAGAEEDDLPF